MTGIGELRFFGRNRLPLILQTERSECGLACLAMVASYHGYRTDLVSLRARYEISPKGVNLEHLVNISSCLNLLTRPVRVELDELDKLTMPAILHWDLNHFVVLKSTQKNKVTIHDPASGIKILGWEEVSRHFTGVSLELVPAQEFEEKVEKRRFTLLQLLGKVPQMWRYLGHILALSAVLQLFSTISPLFMQLVVDSAVVSEDRELIVVLAGGFLMLVVIQVGLNSVRSWAVMVLGITLNLRLQSNLFSHLLRLPMQFFEKRHLGDIVSRFDSLNSIERTLTTGFIEAIVDAAMTIATLSLMAIYSWKLALIVCIAALFYALIRLALYKPLFLASEEQILYEAKQQSNFLETVRGIQSIKLFNREDHRRSLYRNLMVNNFNADIRVQKLNILYTALNGVIFGFENICVISIGGLLVLDGNFSIGMLFAFMSYKGQFTARVVSFIEKTIEFRMLSLHLQRIADIALAEAEPDEKQSLVNTLRIRSYLQIRDLGFRYSQSDPMVFENINFTIEKGESVAITGPSGCGKTTLAKVMLGLLSPCQGEVLVGGIPLEKLSAHAYRDLVGSVMQDDQLFAGSIADNIAFFESHPDQVRVERCAGLAAVNDEIVRMPMGYETLIGDMGTVLSGGQKQRLLLARALYKRPRILFLDEATSHLDVDTERAVNDAIKQLNLTKVIVAHRPQTIASVDRVIELGQTTGTKKIRVESYHSGG